ncbi:MAG: hypothetical protein LAT75_09875 [Candidatus Cyclonatronum sp.]|uniref:hypothetical protein n=1 Tax=Cyclonatronum sp. TaxID=3024185 RepID=UPI0025C4C4E5|nr:hypothetical protein [Cyclonatronum sp.]MCH8487166.1 hypothetical protein [Cyclonatronum sp.]
MSCSIQHFSNPVITASGREGASGRLTELATRRVRFRREPAQAQAQLRLWIQRQMPLLFVAALSYLC